MAATPFSLPVFPQASPDLSGLSAGLTYAERLAIIAAMRRLPEGWRARPDRDGDGNAIVFVCCGEEWDQQAPLFLLWRQQGRLRLGMGQGFEVAELGRFAAVAGALTALEREVRRHAAARPASILLC